MNAIQRTEQNVVNVEENYPAIAGAVTLENKSISKNEYIDNIVDEIHFEIIMAEFTKVKQDLSEFYGRNCWSLSSLESETLMQGLFRLQELLEELKYTDASLSVIEKYTLDFQIVLHNLDVEGIM